MLSEEAIYDMLTSHDVSHGAMAKRYRCHRSAVALIRTGKTHRNVLPEIPRWGKHRTCVECAHWKDQGCDLGFPDPIEEGLWFARDCCTFLKR